MNNLQIKNFSVIGSLPAKGDLDLVIYIIKFKNQHSFFFVFFCFFFLQIKHFVDR